MKRGKVTKKDLLEYRRAHVGELGEGRAILSEKGWAKERSNIAEAGYLLDLGVPDELTSITIKFPIDLLQKEFNMDEDKFDDLISYSTATIETIRFDPEDDEQAHL